MRVLWLSCCELRRGEHAEREVGRVVVVVAVPFGEDNQERARTVDLDARNGAAVGYGNAAREGTRPDRITRGEVNAGESTQQGPSQFQQDPRVPGACRTGLLFLRGHRVQAGGLPVGEPEGLMPNL